MRQFRDVIRCFAEIDIANFEEFLVLKVGEFVRVPAFLVLEVEECIFL